MSIIDAELTRGYTCPLEACDTRVILETALLALVTHDLAETKREDLDPCLELQEAVDVLVKHCGYNKTVWWKVFCEMDVNL